jgi:hypothetical protein
LKVLVKLVGGKVRRGEKNLSFTFHWPPSKEPSPSPSFFFSLKGELGSLELLFFLRDNFQFNLENAHFRKLLEEEKND